MLAAVQNGDAKKLAEQIRQNPGFKVNMDHGNGNTLLHYACREDSSSAVIPLLLAHPDIDVNVKNGSGSTLFYLACIGSTSCAREMLKDSRVKVNEPHRDGYTPLWWAASNGHHDVIKWWIASGREMDLGTPGDVDKTDAIGRAKANGKTEVVSLLERFKSDASKTRSKVRLELGITGKSVSPSCSSLFVLFILHLSFGGLTSFSSSSQFLDFPVTTPPKLTRALYEDYLDDKAIKRDYIAFLERKPVITSTTTTGTKFDLFSFSFSFFFSFNLS